MISAENELRELVAKWAAAVSSGDRNGILARHANDVEMFDFPNELRGIKEYDESWDFFYSKQKGPITFAPSDFHITAGTDVGFVSCKVHCDGTEAGPLDFRLTTGFRKINGQWTAVHEHHSLRKHPVSENTGEPLIQ
jgi:ketosteroid isomerase-like protein